MITKEKVLQTLKEMPEQFSIDDLMEKLIYSRPGLVRKNFFITFILYLDDRIFGDIYNPSNLLMSF